MCRIFPWESCECLMWDWWGTLCLTPFWIDHIMLSWSHTLIPQRQTDHFSPAKLNIKEERDLLQIKPANSSSGWVRAGLLSVQMSLAEDQLLIHWTADRHKATLQRHVFGEDLRSRWHSNLNCPNTIQWTVHCVVPSTKMPERITGTECKEAGYDRIQEFCQKASEASTEWTAPCSSSSIIDSLGSRSEDKH